MEFESSMSIASGLDYFHKYKRLKMAYFGAGAGGNAGGGPGGFRWTWTTPDEHDGGDGRRVRGVTQNLDADDALAANRGQRLPIDFEMGGGHTWHAVGEYAGVYNNLLGARVRNTVPFYFRKWEEVPSYYQDEILAHIRRYFELGPYLDLKEHDPIRKNMLKGFTKDCAKSYRGSKSRFKASWYTKPLEQDGLSLDQLRQLPPPGMPEDMWNDHVDFFSGVRRQRIAEINAQNRQQMPYIARQGRINGARRRHAIYEATGRYPPKIDHWLSVHLDRQGNYISDLVEQHDQMIDLWEQVLAGDLHMDEDQILDEVLHERPGHRKGRGRTWAGNSSMEPQPEPQCSPQFGTPSPFSDFSPEQGQGSGANYYD